MILYVRYTFHMVCYVIKDWWHPPEIYLVHGLIYYTLVNRQSSCTPWLWEEKPLICKEINPQCSHCEFFIVS